jgi:hypothetical protein
MTHGPYLWYAHFVRGAAADDDYLWQSPVPSVYS